MLLAESTSLDFRQIFLLFIPYKLKAELPWRCVAKAGWDEEGDGSAPRRLLVPPRGSAGRAEPGRAILGSGRTGAQRERGDFPLSPGIPALSLSAPSPPCRRIFHPPNRAEDISGGSDANGLCCQKIHIFCHRAFWKQKGEKIYQSIYLSIYLSIHLLSSIYAPWQINNRNKRP